MAAGVRRIEAITGDNVFAYYSNMEKELEEAAKVVKSTPANLKERLEHLIAEMKALQSENESLKSKAAKDALGDVMDQVVDVNGIKLLATSVDGVDMNGLRDLGDSLKEKLGEGVIVLASSNEGKVNLVAMATDAAIKSGAHAGNLIKAIASKVGGGGGGRPVISGTSGLIQGGERGAHRRHGQAHGAEQRGMAENHRGHGPSQICGDEQESLLSWGMRNKPRQIK